MRVDVPPAVVGVAAALLLVFAGTAWLHRNAVADRSATLAALRDNLHVIEQFDVTVERARARRAQLRQTLHDFAEHVPPQAELGEVLEALGRDLTEEQVSDREIATRPTIASRYLMRTPVSLRFRGSFDAGYTMLERLENSRYLIRVDRVQLERPGGEPNRPLQIDLEFSAFSQNAQEFATWATID